MRKGLEDGVRREEVVGSWLCSWSWHVAADRARAEDGGGLCRVARDAATLEVGFRNEDVEDLYRILGTLAVADATA